MNLDQNFIRTRNRRLSILIRENLGAAMFMNDNRLHGWSTRAGIMTAELMDISGKVALITGSSKRIGRETAVELARRGACVAIHYRSDEAGAQETLRLVKEAGSTGEVFRAELTDTRELDSMFSELERKLRRLDILVNNASVFEASTFDESTPELWNAQMDSNAKAPFLIAQRAARLMREHGKIVNLVDVAGE